MGKNILVTIWKSLWLALTDTSGFQKTPGVSWWISWDFIRQNLTLPLSPSFHKNINAISLFEITHKNPFSAKFQTWNKGLDTQSPLSTVIRKIPNCLTFIWKEKPFLTFVSVMTLLISNHFVCINLSALQNVIIL